MTDTTPAKVTLEESDDRIQTWIIWFLRFSLIVAAIYTGVIANWETSLISLLALALTWLPTLIENHYKLTLPIEYELFIVIFIYAGIFLGEVGNAYQRFWWWDVVLHLSSGLVLAYAGFLVLFSLHRRGKLEASAFIISLFAFAFALAMGALWEIFEYFVDSVFGANMQKSGLRDTMTDLMVDSLGAVIVARMTYVYIKTKRGGLISQIVRNFLRKNPKIRFRRYRV